MSLLRTAGRVAVATSVHGSVRRRQADRWAAGHLHQAPAQQAPAQQAPVPQAQAPSTGMDPAQRIAALSQLAELHSAGVLTDVEFAAQKAALLA